MTHKSVLLTGCSTGGIGHALALAFQKRGLTVFATARSLEKMADLESLPNVHLFQLDVTDPASVTALAGEIKKKTGGTLNILVNNAGQQLVMPVLDLDLQRAKALFDVNYWAALMMIQAFASMIVGAKGTIVNVGSTAGDIHIPFQSQYNASKAAINSLSETLRLELAPLNVRVITLMAGGVTSNFGANAPPPSVLSEGSFYLPIHKDIEKKLVMKGMSTAKFAEAVVKDVLNGKTGELWLGTAAWIVRYVAPVMPQWIYDKIMHSIRPGLDRMPKQARV